MRTSNACITEGPADACTLGKKSTFQEQKGEKKIMHYINICIMQLFHPNQMPKFVFEAEKFFKDVASHQIYEGACINNSQSTPGYLMNSRAEFEQGSVARVVVAHGL